MSAVKKLPKGCLIIFAIPFILFGAIFAVWGIYEFIGGMASEDWPATEGAIVRSGVSVDKGDSKDAEPRYIASVEYDYVVNDYEYTGDRIAFESQSFFEENAAKKIIRKYPVGKKVQVFYDPDKPHNSVLEPGTTSNSFLPIVFGIIIMLFGVMAIVAAFKIKFEKLKPGRPPAESPQTPGEPEQGDFQSTGTSVPGRPQSRGKPASKGTLLLIGLGCLAAAAVMFIFGVVNIISGTESKSWPSAEGYVITSYVDKRVEYVGSNRRRTTTYTPVIRYEYNVSGRSYTSGRVCFSGGSGGSDRSDAVEVTEKYPEGAEVKVFYNQEKPEESVLEPGVVWSAIILIAAGLVFLVVAVIIFRSMRKSSEDSLPIYQQ